LELRHCPPRLIHNLAGLKRGGLLAVSSARTKITFGFEMVYHQHIAHVDDRMRQ
jgi:hypothetical protein